MLTKFPPTGSKHIECPKIEPVTEGLHRPRWSVMIPTYNRTKYLNTHKCVEQDLGPDAMQIEVIDNCSTSADIEAEINNISSHKVSFYRQLIGPVANFTACIQRARGHWFTFYMTMM